MVHEPFTINMNQYIYIAAWILIGFPHNLIRSRPLMWFCERKHISSDPQIKHYTETMNLGNTNGIRIEVDHSSSL